MSGLLVLSIDETQRICKETSSIEITWNEEDKGNILKKLTKVPSISSTKIYYNSCGYYFFLEMINDISCSVLKLCRIFDIPIRRFHTGTMRKKDYFMFECLPEHENFIKIKLKEEIAEEVKLIAVFHWIIGVKGKILCRSTESEVEFFSCSPYILDYRKSDFSDSKFKKLVPDRNTKISFGNFFYSKIDRVENYLNKKSRWWFLEIYKRIKLLVEN